MRFIALAAALLTLGPGLAWAMDGPLRQTAWLANASPMSAFTQAPPECLAEPGDKDARYRVEVGRAAFRSPLLLGGQAARHQLSCQACHINGNDNPYFFIAGLSAAPGTVDVTSSLFSEVRGDGIFNPVPIPSLVGAGDRKSFGHAKAVHSLPQFVKGVIMDEFASDGPPKAVFDAVIAYVRALKPGACPKSGPVPVTLGTYVDDVTRAADALDEALKRGDGETADFLVLAIQSRLGELDEWYAGARLTEASGGLADVSRALGALRPTVKQDQKAARGRLKDWRARFESVTGQLKSLESQSLFNSAVLATAIINASSEQ